jgi:DNA mismatch repair protein MSH4
MHIDKVVNDDNSIELDSLSARNQRCSAVKSGFNAFLDIARQAYEQGTNEAYEMIKNLESDLNLPLKQEFNNPQGFHISIPISALGGAKAPEVLIQISARKSKVIFTTLDLLKINERIKQSLNEIYMMSETQVLIGSNFKNC